MEATTTNQGDTKMNQLPSLYSIPEIASLMRAEREATDPALKVRLHNEWTRLMKIEQIKRGQRTKWTYRKSSK
jgi:hypothetical protein